MATLNLEGEEEDTEKVQGDQIRSRVKANRT